jgi:hypothetical protein
MRQCHWSRAKMYGRHSGLFGSSLGSGILIISRGRVLGCQLPIAFVAARVAPPATLSDGGETATEAAAKLVGHTHFKTPST